MEQPFLSKMTSLDNFERGKEIMLLAEQVETGRQIEECLL